MNSNVILINPKDNVAVSKVDIGKGEEVVLDKDTVFSALSDIPYSHKVAITDIQPDTEIIKYGEVIGRAKEKLEKGQWVHAHNMIIGEA